MRQDESEPAVLKYAAVPAKKRPWWWMPWYGALAIAIMPVLVVLLCLLHVATSIPTKDPRFITQLCRGLIVPGGVLATEIDQYRHDAGRYPAVLTDLTTRPADTELAAKWNGPYIRDANSLRDVWGNWLQYRVPGRKNPATYDLWSVGPDGMNGTADDIGNW